jgi:polyisoprenyl-teichoic acid--peptidoglycan teichoic acid transferase
MARRPSRVLPALGVFLATASSVVVAGNYYVSKVPSSVATVDVGNGVFDTTPQATASKNEKAGPTENYLLVGSDSRNGADKNDADYGGIISKTTPAADNGQGTSSRSDTMLILRYDPKTKHGTLMSIPRDLRVTIADTGKQAKINAAFERDDPVKAVSNLIQTIRNFGIPINHYVEIDFNGFKQVVDAIGGVRLHFDQPAKDPHTGFEALQATCITMNGVQSRQYVRSRYLEIFVKGKWHTDGSSDIGRMARQQDFLQRALNQAIVKVSTDPAALSRLISAGTANVKTDPGTDLVKFAGGLRSMSKGALDRYTLPTAPSGEDLVVLRQEAAPLLAFFRGETDTVVTTTEAPPQTAAPKVGNTTPATAAVAPPSTKAGPTTTAARDPLDEPFVPVSDC